MLEIINKELIIYHGEEMRYTILGGIRIETTDRMRVTLKVEVINRKYKHLLNHPDLADLAIRQSLDLYNDTQVEKLIRKLSDRLEVGSTQIAVAINDMTNQLESYRIEELQKILSQSEPQIQALTAKEREKAIEFLSEPELLKRTNEMISQSGIIGEVNNRLLMYLIFTSRKLKHPLQVVSLAGSGTGKTHLQESVARLIPREEQEPVTDMTANALYSAEPKQFSHKLILIEDLDAMLKNLLILRELQSKSEINKLRMHKTYKGKNVLERLKVEGPVCIASCTTKERIYEDNANRSFLIYLDESEEQDERIMDYQRKKKAGLINEDEEKQAQYFLQTTQRMLEPITIRNPYAPYLKIPKEILKPRRTNQHYLDFIEVVTFYYQYQREQKVDERTGEIYIETQIEDIQVANELIKDILLRKSDMLSGACRNYFEKLKAKLKDEREKTFTNMEMSLGFRKAYSTIKRYHKELTEAGLIKQIKSQENQLANLFELVEDTEYQSLQKRIHYVLEEVIHQLPSLTSPSPLSIDIERTKSKKTKQVA
jgi:hypothetical protein